MLKVKIIFVEDERKRVEGSRLLRERKRKFYLRMCPLGLKKRCLLNISICPHHIYSLIKRWWDGWREENNTFGDKVHQHI